MVDSARSKLRRMLFTVPPAHRHSKLQWYVCSGAGTDLSLPIAETTIVAGAKYLERAAELITERYKDEVSVVYGDTDSVFLKTVRNLNVPDAIQFLIWISG
jgi:hypothetical protein